MATQDSFPPELSGKHRKTLEIVLRRKQASNLRWGDFVSLMEALGAEVESSGGSAHSFLLEGRIIVVHKPHPGGEMAKPAVKRVRSFLIELGITA